MTHDGIWSMLESNGMRQRATDRESKSIDLLMGFFGQYEKKYCIVSIVSFLKHRATEEFSLIPTAVIMTNPLGFLSLSVVRRMYLPPLSWRWIEEERGVKQKANGPSYRRGDCALKPRVVINKTAEAVAARASFSTGQQRGGYCDHIGPREAQWIQSLLYTNKVNDEHRR